MHAGVWATLQFKWVQLQYPVVVLAFEKLLLGCCLPVAATVQAWGVIAAIGLGVASFYLAAILAVLYYLFALPVPSSFAAGAHRSSIGQCCMCTPNSITMLKPSAMCCGFFAVLAMPKCGCRQVMNITDNVYGRLQTALVCSNSSCHLQLLYMYTPMLCCL